ncbi:MAG: M20/M25/M40 family metallo-hydrolase [Candidatus Cloacimonetes bacterium]|nr:M20/M25/M40 family metallo-hydrolase [Candidatus Cloacimonadota bacterium]MBS3767617.1 M20/M25/M40 family metallo-hydrolase [Candidatus Cloacimonadota bacterium]
MCDDLIDYFIELVQIDSESKDELKVAQKIEKDILELGGAVLFDEAHKKTGGNVGNLVAKIPGKIDKEPLLFCAHMDTVVPGKGIKPIIKDGIISSESETILGSDDKAGIAEVMIAIKNIQKKNLDYAPIELLFTISEEIGLRGAINLDYSLLDSKFGYSLDSSNIGSITTRAPALDEWKVTFKGREAHAGMDPDRGINAIKVAADALNRIPQGRIDHETTINTGKINGGGPHNIVASKAVVEGEIRSHNLDTLQETKNLVGDIFTQVAKEHKIKINNKTVMATAEFAIEKNFSNLEIDDDAEIVKLAKESAKETGLQYSIDIGGGGSDANILYDNGIVTPILGTGMNNVHSKSENIKIKDMQKTLDWIEKIIELYSKK